MYFRRALSDQDCQLARSPAIISHQAKWLMPQHDVHMYWQRSSFKQHRQDVIQIRSPMNLMKHSHVLRRLLYSIHKLAPAIESTIGMDLFRFIQEPRFFTPACLAV